MRADPVLLLALRTPNVIMARYCLALPDVVPRCYCHLVLIGASRSRLRSTPGCRILAFVDLLLRGPVGVARGRRTTGTRRRPPHHPFPPRTGVLPRAHCRVVSRPAVQLRTGRRAVRSSSGVCGPDSSTLRWHQHHVVSDLPARPPASGHAQKTACAGFCPRSRVIRQLNREMTLLEAWARFMIQSS